MIIVYEVLNFFNFPRPKVESKKICCFSRNSIALALAKHCIGTCKALRWHLQSIALPHAKHCNNHCLEFVELALITWWTFDKKNEPVCLAHSFCLLILSRYFRKLLSMYALVAVIIAIMASIMFVTIIFLPFPCLV